MKGQREHGLIGRWEDGSIDRSIERRQDRKKQRRGGTRSHMVLWQKRYLATCVARNERSQNRLTCFRGIIFDQKLSPRASKIDPRVFILEPGEESEGSGVRLGRPLAPQGASRRAKSAENNIFLEVFLEVFLTIF